MSHTKNHAPVVQQSSYEAEMSTLRERLAGRSYVNGVKNMLPDLSKDHIRNVVNGKCSNQLVLAALKIVLHKLDLEQQEADKRLSELTGKLEELGVAA
jgi:hypothetical protein